MGTGLEPPQRSIEERDGEWLLRGSVAKVWAWISVVAGVVALLSLFGVVPHSLAGAAALPPAGFWLWVLWQSDKQNARDHQASR